MYENLKNYRWLKVEREKMGTSETNSAKYSQWVITLFDYFFTAFTPVKQKAVLEHEYAHHLFNSLPKAVKMFWYTFSNTNRVYINSHAKKNYFEDFGECIEAQVLIDNHELEKQSWMLNLKIEIANKIYNKYLPKVLTEDLVEKYDKSPVDTDNLYWHQCVDLVKQYSNEYLLQPLWTFGGSAKTGWENKSNTFPEELWEKINYTGENKPKVWDIVFYNNEPYGHTGVCVWPNFVIFEQNAWTWSGYGAVNYCRIELMSKQFLAGWYRLKK